MRAFALARSVGQKTDLATAIHRLGYVQADPIRSPARAQDLILMQRVRGYRAGDLEKHYVSLEIEEDMLHNYGFIPREVQRLVHPRQLESTGIERQVPGLSEAVLAFVRERGAVHPRDLDAHFVQSAVDNAWGGNSSATTRALDGLHYRGALRIVRRDKGTRVYAAADHLEALDIPGPDEQARGLVQLLLKQYAPLPVQSLGGLVSLLAKYGAPHLKTELRTVLKSLAAERAVVDGLTYLWPEGEAPGAELPRKVRFVAPFDPLVWDRRRFEHFHGWAYRFEAYTPAAKRLYGYYALPLLWGAEAIGWANLKVTDGVLETEIGFMGAAPKTKVFAAELEQEIERYRGFLRSRQ